MNLIKQYFSSLKFLILIGYFYDDYIKMNSSSKSSQKNSYRKVKKISHTPQKHIVTGMTQTTIPLNQQSQVVTSPQNQYYASNAPGPQIVQYVDYQAPPSSTIAPPKRQTHKIQKYGMIYEGGVINNTFHGEGILYKPNSTDGRYVYKGRFQKGVKSGFGHYIYPDGSEYRGEWRNNMKQGLGTYTNNNLEQYEGRWIQNMRDGNGKLQLRDGTKLEGFWKNDQFISGMINYPNGSTYLGEMVNYARHGQGTFTFPDKSQYKGPWINNMKNGRGQYYFSNGDQYRGGFKDNIKHGTGCQYIWRQGGYELRDATFVGDVYQSGSGNVQERRRGNQQIM